MKKVFNACLVCVAAAALLVYGLTLLQKKEWKGVDDTVVNKYAEAAGHPAWKPFIDTDQGDMLLFFFLIAGVCGGFVAGYASRELFGASPAEPGAELPRAGAQEV